MLSSLQNFCETGRDLHANFRRGEGFTCIFKTKWEWKNTGFKTMIGVENSVLALLPMGSSGRRMWGWKRGDRWNHSVVKSSKQLQRNLITWFWLLDRIKVLKHTKWYSNKFIDIILNDNSGDETMEACIFWNLISITIFTDVHKTSKWNCIKSSNLTLSRAKNIYVSL